MTWLTRTLLLLGVACLTATTLASAAPPPGSVFYTGLENGIAEWSENAGVGGAEFNAYQPSGAASATVVSNRDRTGTRSLRMTIDTTDEKAAVRMTRYNEASRDGVTYVYGAWYWLPSKVTPTNGMWNVMQWKAKPEPGAGASAPVWTINLVGDPLRLVVKWKGGDDASNTGFPGPFASSPTSQKQYTQTLKTIPYRSWFEIRARLRITADYTGELVVWQGATKLFDFQNVRSTYSAAAIQSWGVDHYSNGLNVNPYSIWVDDAYVRTP